MRVEFVKMGWDGMGVKERVRWWLFEDRKCRMDRGGSHAVRVLRLWNMD